MSYGDPKWRPWVLPEKDSQKFFKKAIQLGINFFDTADMYSLGVSEEITGKALKKYANLDECVIATKVFGSMSNKPNMGGLSRKHIQQSCEASLRRLGVDTIDLYQIHRFDINTPIEETMSTLNDLVRQGKVRYIGASSMWAWQFSKAQYVAELHGWSKFVSMQNHYNLIFREEEREMIPLCEDMGVGLIPWSPLARGVLAGNRKSIYDKKASKRSESDAMIERWYTQDDFKIIKEVNKIAKEKGIEPAHVAYGWVLSKKQVTAPIIGATKIKHLESAVKSLEVELSKDEVLRLERLYGPHVEPDLPK